MSTIFAVVLDSPTPEAWESIKMRWPEAHIHKNAIAFVPDDVSRMTKEIADEAGIGENLEGIVIQLDYFYGYTDDVLAEWIRKNSR